MAPTCFSLRPSSGSLQLSLAKVILILKHGNRCADHVTSLYPQKLALTSPTGGGRSVGTVRLRTKATEFFLIYFFYYLYKNILYLQYSGI